MTATKILQLRVDPAVAEQVDHAALRAGYPARSDWLRAVVVDALVPKVAAEPEHSQLVACKACSEENARLRALLDEIEPCPELPDVEALAGHPCPHTHRARLKGSTYCSDCGDVLG